MFSVMLCCLPFLVVDHLPFIDVPNHIARLLIRDDIRAGGSLGTYYSWEWRIIPNMALEILSAPFAGRMDPEAVVIGLYVAGVVALCAGAFWIDRSLNGPHWGVSLLTGVIIFNGALRFGFTNYFLGLAVAVPLFAAWVHFRPRLGIASLLLFAFAGLGLMHMHLYAYGLYALCVVGYEIGLLFEERPRLQFGNFRGRLPLLGVGVMLAVPGVLLLAGPMRGSAGIVAWSGFGSKLRALVSPIYFNQPVVEGGLLLLLGAAMVAGLVTRTLRVHARMMPVLVLLGLAFLAMPVMLFGSYHADYRLLSGAAFFVIGAVRFVPGTRTVLRVGVAVAVLGLLVRVGSITAEWILVQPVLREQIASMAPVPPGARVLLITGDVRALQALGMPKIGHFAVLGLTRRGAMSGSLFMADFAFPLRLQPAFREYVHDNRRFPPPLDLDRYDYVQVIGEPPRALLESHRSDEIGRGTFHTLFRVLPR